MKENSTSYLCVFFCTVAELDRISISDWMINEHANKMNSRAKQMSKNLKSEPQADKI